MDDDRLDELIEKYAAGTITPEELRELLEWYRSAEIGAVKWPASQPDERDRLQQRMLMRLQTQVRAAGENPAVPGIPAVPEIPAAPARRRLFRLGAWQIAACLALLFCSIWLFRGFLHRTDAPAWVTVSNPTGKIQAIGLPDGSKVWLNAASTLRYSAHPSEGSGRGEGSRRDDGSKGDEGSRRDEGNRFGEGDNAPREIYLEGEGYFEVAEDPAHSFIVHAGSLTTTVLGTRFDVKSFAGEQLASVSVISGKVRVQDSARVLDVLTAARQLQLDARTGRSTTVSIDTSQVVGWRLGRLQFTGQTMDEIAASLGRWYNVQFVFANPAISHCRYYLNFDNTIPLKQMLAVMTEATDLSFREDTARHTVTISGKGCQ